MVLGKLPVPEGPVNLDYSRARASALAVGAGWGLTGHFFSHLSFSSSSSLCETTRYRLKYCLKGPLNPNNQPANLDNSKARAYGDCSRCGRGLLTFFPTIISLLFLPLSGRRPDIDLNTA